MTEKRFDFLEKRGYGYCIGIIDNQTGKHLGYVGIRDVMNQLHEENQCLIQEGKHQQGQKQRLINYLKQYLTVEEIREILNECDMND